jgi:hypothetical protein
VLAHTMNSVRTQNLSHAPFNRTPPLAAATHLSAAHPHDRSHANLSANSATRHVIPRRDPTHHLQNVTHTAQSRPDHKASPATHKSSRFRKQIQPHHNLIAQTQPHANSSAILCFVIFVGPAASCLFSSPSTLLLHNTIELSRFCVSTCLVLFVYLALRQPNPCLYFLWFSMFCFCLFPCRRRLQAFYCVVVLSLSSLWQQTNTRECVLSVLSSLVSCERPPTVAKPSRARLVI